MNNDKDRLRFILLPGLDGTGILAKPFAKQFTQSESLDVIVYPTTINDNTLENLAQNIEEKLKRETNCILIGESFGGLVLLEILKRKKLKLKAVIFLVAFAEPPKPKLLKLIQTLPIDNFPWSLVPRLFIKHLAIGSDATDEQISLVQLTTASVDPKLLAHRLRVIASDPMSRLDNHWSIPCLYIQGNDDKIVPEHCVNWFKKHFSSFTLSIIEGGHFLLHTRIAQCIKCINNFKKELLINDKTNELFYLKND